jgi:hypothetical protein
MTQPPTRAAGYLRFLAWVVAVTAVVALLGVLPTRRLGGSGALPALLAGCTIGIVGSALGGVPLALAAGKPAAARIPAVLGAMLLRLAAVAALGTAAVLSGRFARGPLLLWIAISYAALLVVDTRYALHGQPGDAGNVGNGDGNKNLET